MNSLNDRNHVSDSPMSSELLYDELMLDEWYWNAFGKDLDNKTWYHQKYYEDFGVEGHAFYKGPTDPNYLHDTLTNDAMLGIA